MVGLKNGYTCKNLTQNVEPQRYSWGTQKKEKKNRVRARTVLPGVSLLAERDSLIGSFCRSVAARATKRARVVGRLKLPSPVLDSASRGLLLVLGRRTDRCWTKPGMDRSCLVS